MIMRSVLVLALAILPAVLAGCGNAAGRFPVSGKVTYQGEPAAGAVVYFHRQMEPGSPSESIMYGIVEDDGSFQLTSDDLGNGARPGSYIVLVEWRDGSGDRVERANAQGQGQAGEAQFASEVAPIGSKAGTSTSASPCSTPRSRPSPTSSPPSN